MGLSSFFPNDSNFRLDQALLPLFPLRLVLFPGQVLPLHVFEPRYHTMISDCLLREEPFGIVLLRDDMADWRTYQQNVALPHAVGTTAHIRGVEHLTDGRMNIVVTGLHRFRVRTLHFDKPFLRGDVETLPLIGSAPTAQVETLSRRLQGYLHLLSQIVQNDIDLGELPQDPGALAYLVASALQIPWEEKQALLEIATVPDLLAQEQRVLAKEASLLRFMHGSEDRIEDQILGATGYLYPN
ncbi:MAG: LON peptidase substrate-binding domain-containing protein [Caldilineales bacterium]